MARSTVAALEPTENWFQLGGLGCPRTLPKSLTEVLLTVTLRERDLVKKGKAG